MTAREVLEAYNDAVLNRHELNRLDEFTTSEALKKAATAFVDAFPDLRVDLEFTVEEGGVVGCRARGSGTHSGTAIRHLTPRGGRWSASCHAFFRVEGEVIAEAWTLWDWASITNQLEETGSS